MPLLHRFLHLLQDPPPEYIFEISEAGLAYVRPGVATPAFEPLEPGVISVSPLVDNVLQPEQLQAAVMNTASAAGGRKRRKAVLILPDFCARVAVLEFDGFPSDPKEQLPLVKFRMKKSVPFDVESAAISYSAQAAKGSAKRFDVVVVVAALEIVGRYEAAFRAAGLHPGVVTTSAMAMTELERSQGISVVARLSGKVLTVCVFRSGVLKLIRCIELPEVTREEVMGVLFPTIAYVEDEMGAPPNRVVTCGFDAEGTAGWELELNVPVETLTSRFGTPNQTNAGLHAYLESMVQRGEARVA